jgi:hypothetical protein
MDPSKSNFKLMTSRSTEDVIAQEKECIKSIKVIVNNNIDAAPLVKRIHFVDHKTERDLLKKPLNPFQGRKMAKSVR